MLYFFFINVSLSATHAQQFRVVLFINNLIYSGIFIFFFYESKASCIICTYKITKISNSIKRKDFLKQLVHSSCNSKYVIQKTRVTDQKQGIIGERKNHRPPPSNPSPSLFKRVEHSHLANYPNFAAPRRREPLLRSRQR